MSFATTTQDDAIVIRVPDRFDFRQAIAFRSMVDDVLRMSRGEIVVDLNQTTYIDSSALGMLLVLRDRARALDKLVVIKRAGGSVRETLSVANFEKLFAFR